MNDRMPANRWPHGQLTQRVIGTFFNLWNRLGYGFLEAVYKNGMVVLLRQSRIEVAREVPYDITLDGVNIGHYRADLVAEWSVIIEVKTARRIDPVQSAQLRNYLRASKLPVGLLLNFGPKPEFRRIGFRGPINEPSGCH